jgi:hypothetical protein
LSQIKGKRFMYVLLVPFIKPPPPSSCSLFESPLDLGATCTLGLLVAPKMCISKASNGPCQWLWLWLCSSCGLAESIIHTGDTMDRSYCYPISKPQSL